MEWSQSLARKRDWVVKCAQDVFHSWSALCERPRQTSSWTDERPDYLPESSLRPVPSPRMCAGQLTTVPHTRCRFYHPRAVRPELAVVVFFQFKILLSTHGLSICRLVASIVLFTFLYGFTTSLTFFLPAMIFLNPLHIAAGLSS